MYIGYTAIITTMALSVRPFDLYTKEILLYSKIITYGKIRRHDS